jgi:hypothetical protein
MKWLDKNGMSGVLFTLSTSHHMGIDSPSEGSKPSAYKTDVKTA